MASMKKKSTSSRTPKLKKFPIACLRCHPASRHGLFKLDNKPNCGQHVIHWTKWYTHKFRERLQKDQEHNKILHNIVNDKELKTQTKLPDHSNVTSACLNNQRTKLDCYELKTKVKKTNSIIN